MTPKGRPLSLRLVPVAHFQWRFALCALFQSSSKSLGLGSQSGRNLVEVLHLDAVAIVGHESNIIVYAHAQSSLESCQRLRLRLRLRLLIRAASRGARQLRRPGKSGVRVEKPHNLLLSSGRDSSFVVPFSCSGFPRPPSPSQPSDKESSKLCLFHTQRQDEQPRAGCVLHCKSHPQQLGRTAPHANLPQLLMSDSYLPGTLLPPARCACTPTLLTTPQALSCSLILCATVAPAKSSPYSSHSTVC